MICGKHLDGSLKTSFFLISVLSTIVIVAFISHVFADPAAITLNSPGNSTLTNDNTPDFNFTISGSNSSYFAELFIGGIGNGTNTSTLNFTATVITANTTLSDGLYIWYINATNVSTLQSEIRTITIDTTPPVITLESPTNTTFTVADIDYNITVDENLSVALVSIDGSSNLTMTNDSTSHYFNLSGTHANLSDGLHNATFWVNDTAGNANQSIVYFTMVLPPSVIINAPLNGSVIASVLLNWTLDDPNDENMEVFVYGSNDSAYLNESLLYHRTGISDGTYTYSFTSPVVLSNSQDIYALYHLNNQSEFGENDTLVYDFSGNGHNGTVFQNSTANISGYFAGAYEFDGDTDYVRIGNGSDFSDVCAGNECTFAAWFNTQSAIGVRAIIGRYDTAGDNKFFLLYQSSTVPVFLITDNGQSASCTAFGNIPIATDQWYHMVGVWNGSHTFVYLNGVLDDSTDCAFSSINETAWQDSEDTFIGIYDDSSFFGDYNGTIDEVAIWNRSLSATEILDLYRLREDTYFWNVNATDGTSYTNNGTFEFTLSIPPIITIESPTNTTYVTADIDYNITVDENLSVALVSIDGSSNLTMTNDSTSHYFNLSGTHANLSDGLHNATFWVNDTAGNANQSIVYFTTEIGSNVTVCRNLNLANTVYTLLNSVSATGTCFNLLANNITLDCQGFSITYGTGATGNGINLTGVNESAIQSCNVTEGSISGLYAIYLTNSDNNTVRDSTVSTTGSSDYAVYLLSSDSNNVTNNTITTTGSSAYGTFLSSSSSNIIENNTINTGTGSNAYAVYLSSSSSNNTIKNNTITTTGSSGKGIYLITSTDNTIKDNSITTSGSTSAYGMYLSGSDRCVVDSNNVTTTSTSNSNYGIYLSGADNCTVTSNNVSTAGSSSYGLLVLSDDNNVSSNTVTTTGSFGYGLYLSSMERSNLASNKVTTSGSSAIGIYMPNSDNNILALHTITTSGTSNAYGIYMFSGSDNNNFTSSSINTTGASSTAYGAYLSNADGNIFKDASIGSSSANDIRIDTGDNSMINATFDKMDVGFVGGSTGSITVKWYLDAAVNDQFGNSILESNVTGYDVNSVPVFSEFTLANGSTSRQTLEEYTQDISNTVYKTNYTVNATKYRGLKTPVTATQQVNLTGNTNIVLTLSIVDVVSVETFQSNNSMRSFFGGGETIRIKANTTNLTGFTPKVTIKYPNTTTAVNYADMVTESSNYYFYDYNTTSGNPIGYYDVVVTIDSGNVSKPFNNSFYIGDVWTDGFNNITYLFRMQANVSEPNVSDRFFEPVDIVVNFSDQAFNDSIRVVFYNGSHYIEIPSQIYNLTQSNGSVSVGNVVWLSSMSQNTNRTYFIAWKGTSVPNNYSSDINYTNSTPSYEIFNTYYNVTLNRSYGGLLHDARNKFGSNSGLGGISPMEFYPQAQIILPPTSTLSMRDHVSPNISIEAGPVFIDYVASGFLSAPDNIPVVEYNYTVSMRFFARNMYYTEEKTLDILETGSKTWNNYFDEQIAWGDGIFSRAQWENSSGLISGQNISTGNNADAIGLDPNMRWITAYDDQVGDAFGIIFLQRTNANETSPSIDFFDENFDFYQRTMIASSTIVNPGSSFYDKTARVVYDGSHEYSLVDDLYDILNNPVNVTLGVQENFDKIAPKFVDFNVTPLTPTDQQNVTCYSRWTDNIDLYQILVEENTSGIFVNNTVSVTGMSADGNWTINASDLNAGVFQCRFYGLDSSLNTNVTSSVLFTVTDLTAPEVSNESSNPNTSSNIDPLIPINITVSVIDYTAIDSVIFQYKEWNVSSFLNLSMNNLSAGIFRATFTPNTENNWTYRIFTNDSLGNIGYTSETNISVDYDYTWNISTDDFGASSAPLGTNTTLGVFTINNTGDFPLNFVFSSNLEERVYYNDSDFNVPANDSRTINVTGQADDVERSDDIVITVDATNSTASPSQMTINATLVSFTSGPFLLTQITQYDTSVTQGDTGILLKGKLTNKGNETATLTQMRWTLPTGWSTTDNTTHDIGTLNVDGFKNRNITVDIGSSAPTGEQTLTLTSTCCNDSNRTKTDSVIVVVSSVGGEEEVIIQLPGGGGGGGDSGGGGGITEEEKEQLFKTEERFELVRGEDTEFAIIIENPFEEDFEDVAISVSGFLANRIRLDKTSLGTLKPNESVSVTVFIDAPSYFSQGLNELVFTISGIKGGVSIIEERTVILVIHELPIEEALEFQTNAELLLKEMRRLGFATEEMESLVSQIKTKIEEGDFLAVKELSERAQDIRDTAVDAFNVIGKTETELNNLEVEGLSAPKAVRLHNLAKAAFERGDFSLAKSRADEALLTLALEIKGEFNYLNFVIRNWWQVSLAGFLVFLLGLGAYFRARLTFVNRELKSLDSEEGIIIGLIKELQRDCFELAKMSMDEYSEAVTQYEDKLSKNTQRKIELESMKANLFNFSKKRALIAEEKKLLELMKDTQKLYLEEKSIETNIYFRRMKSLRERLIVVEEKLTTLEAKEAISKKSRKPFGL